MKRPFHAAAVLGATFVLAWSWPSVPRAEDSPLFAAMQDEMQRSMAELKLQGEPSPYLIEYQIDDTSGFRALARLGGLVDQFSGRSRTLRVSVRVGDYNFDSSRFISQERSSGLVPQLDGGITAPLDDDYNAIRREIWLTTDAAYKRAVSTFAKKKAAFQNRAATDAIPDLSREKPLTLLLPSPPPRASAREWVDRVQQLSAAFGTSPEFDTSEVGLTEERGTSYYLNSEGFKTTAPIHMAYVRILAEVQAEDGAPVRGVVSLVENRLEDLPPMAALMSRVQALKEDVAARRSAPVGEEFTGPVLVEGLASAELLRQTLVPLLLARRAPDAENLRFAQGAQALVTPFLSRIGLRVMSDSLSASDSPSLKEFSSRPVPGAYELDDESMPAKDVKLVEGGRLVTLLTSRTPQKNLLQSNGHGRTGTVQPGVFQLSSAQAVPSRDLRAKFLALLKAQDKQFGYIVRAVAGPGDAQAPGPGGPVILEAVKVTPDGAESPVRGLRFGAVAPSAFRDILEASEERTLYSYRLNSATAASVIVPSLIFEELEVQRTRDIAQKPPIVSSPLR